MKLNNVLFVFLFLFAPLFHFGQEGVSHLGNRGAEGTHKLKSSRSVNDITYLLDTLGLPFQDDFAQYRFKDMNLPENHARVFDSTVVLFKVNSTIVDSIYLKLDTVYNSFYNPTTKKFDSTPANPLRVTFFNNSFQAYTPTDTLYAWKPEQFIFRGTQITKELLPPDTLLKNTDSTNLYARDDGYSLWISEGAFFNYSLSKNPPTIGVVTFDGLDEEGLPRDASSDGSYGLSDLLTSKPIDLTRKSNGTPIQANDSVYLSFFYQAQGYGEQPDPEDSLGLEFFNINTNRWVPVWFAPSNESEAFKEVFILINDTNYLKRGFRFRFKNYATLSANFDHWHIDYIRLDANRQPQDQINDYAFLQQNVTLLSKYTAMPYEHFKTDPYEYMLDTVQMFLRNLSNNTDISTNQYKVYDHGSVNPFYISNRINRASIAAQSRFDISMPVREAAPTPFVFPTDRGERTAFDIEMTTFSTTDVNRINDTIRFTQIFDRYYAYDDGVPELAYNINLLGTTLAYEFESAKEDTLRSILFNFQKVKSTIVDRTIKIMVYTNLDSLPIYESTPVDIQYAGLTDFVRYQLPEGLAIPKGNFYVGWQQTDQLKTYVGMDVNRDNSEHIYYSYRGEWYNSEYKGSLLIRPDFGDGSEQPLSIPSIDLQETALDISIYPNPTSDEIHITSSSAIASLKVLDLSGRSLLKQTQQSDKLVLNVEQLPDGVYILEATDITGATQREKFIKAAN